MTTIFTRDVIEKTFKQGFKAIKLASFDCNSFPLAKEIIANDPDLLIVSTGCSYKKEIEEMAHIIRGIKNHAMLHCVSIYPTPIKEAHIARLNYLSQLVNSVGLSDHSNYNKDGNTILKWAVCEGIDFLERHFTILGKEKTKDGAVSLSPNELSEAVAICNWTTEQKDTFKKQNKRQELEIKGNSNRELSHVELLNRDYYQGRFASLSNQGETIFNWDDSFNAKDIKHIK